MLLLMCLVSLSQTQTLLKYTEKTVMGVDYGCKVFQMMLIWPVSDDFVKLEMFGMEWTQQLMQIWSVYFDQGNCMDISQSWSLWKFMSIQMIFLKYSWVVSLCVVQDVAFVGSIILTLPNLSSWVENVLALCSLIDYIFYRKTWLQEWLYGYQATGLMLHSFKDDIEIVVILRSQRDKYKHVSGYMSYVSTSISIYGLLGSLHLG